MTGGVGRGVEDTVKGVRLELLPEGGTYDSIGRPERRGVTEGCFRKGRG